ncbi:MmyB family transcriptional regulator, partial [Streptomyces sp. NPDC002996]
RTLRLDESQRVYVRQLAGVEASCTTRQEITDPDPFRPFVDNWGPYPAYIADRYWNVLVANHAARTLLGVDDEDNLLWQLFTSGDTPARHPGWEQETARETVARFRSQSAHFADDARMRQLLRQLHSASREFARLWNLHEVTEDACGPALLHHPETGPLQFKRTTLDFTDRIALRLTVYVPQPGTGTARAVESLFRRLPGTPSQDDGHAGEPQRLSGLVETAA